MNLRSLRWRLLLVGAVAVLAALALSAAALAALFERHVERVAVAELEARALVLAAIVEQEPGSAAILSGAPVDPLYDQPFSGRYWQIVLGQEMRRSRSLWDFVLAMEETASPPGETRVRAVPGPRGEPLLAVETALLVGQGANQQRLRILVATDRTQLDLARRGFLGDLLPFVGLFALLLIGASWVQISVGLKPLAEVGRRVAALAGGTRPRMGEDLPTEVIPLARQIDTLLDARDDELARARHRAGDLAHGFKTPLQALLGDAGLLRERGETEVAGSVETVALAMRRLVDRELARARIQSDRTAASADPGLVLEKIDLSRIAKVSNLDTPADHWLRIGISMSSIPSSRTSTGTP